MFRLYKKPMLMAILLTAFFIQGCTAMLPTPNGSSDPQPTNSPGVFMLLPYKPLVMEYDPSKWSDKSEHENTTQMVNFLESISLETCRVGIAGASGFFPDTTEPVQLGDVKYIMTTESDPATGLVTGYYFEDHSLDGFNYEMGVAVITIQAHSDDWEACKTSGEYVLSTLHAP